MGIFNADVIINIPPAFFSLQKSGLVRVYLTSVFLLLSVPRCFGDQKPQFDSYLTQTKSLNLITKVDIRKGTVPYQGTKTTSRKPLKRRITW